MRLPTISLLAATLALTPFSSGLAALINVRASGNVTNQSGPRFEFAVALSDSVTPLPSGVLVQIGYFTNSVSSVGTNLSPAQLAAFKASFVQFSTNTLSNVSVPGRLTNIVFNSSFGPFRPTNQLAIWIWNTSSELTASQVGIFTATNWTFPIVDGGAGSATFLLFATNFSSSNLVAFAGSIDGAGNPSRSVNLAMMIPEPGTAVTGFAIAAVTLAARRRRFRPLA